jgi:hypothetical protein
VADQPEHSFKKFIELASKPQPSEKEAGQRDDDYTDTQTRLCKAEDTSGIRSGTGPV